MTTFHANIFDHINIPQDPPAQNPRAHQVTVLPLNLIALIISFLDNVADLARVCQVRDTTPAVQKHLPDIL